MDKKIKQIKFIQTIVWFQMTIVIFILIFVANVMASSSSNPVLEKVKFFETYFPTIAIVLGLISIYLWSHFKSAASLSKIITRKLNSPTAAINQITGEQVVLIINALFPYWIISLVLSEMITIMGFLLSLSTADPARIYLFAITTFAINLYLRPWAHKTSLAIDNFNRTRSFE